MLEVNELLGVVALHQKRYDESVSLLSEADTKSVYVMYDLGKAYAGRRDMEKAVECYRKAATTYEIPDGVTQLSLKDALVRKAALRELES